MPEPEPTLRDLLKEMEDLQKQVKGRLGALDPTQSALPPNELIAACGRLLVLSSVFLDMASTANKSAQSLMRQSEGT
jgi:hypothetical protein